MVVGADAPTGTYTPIANTGSWSGSGTYQALGGTWNSTNHTVTVNAAATTTSGVAAQFDPYTTQRVLVNDPSGKSVGAGFQATSAAGTTYGFTANTSANTGSITLAAGQTVLSGWTFSVTGLTSGSPAYLSLYAGSGQTLYTLSVWDYNGTAWSQLTTPDLAYDGTYASFTTTLNLNSNDIAVAGTAPVPIPSALLLLGPGLAGLGIMRKRIFG